MVGFRRLIYLGLVPKPATFASPSAICIVHAGAAWKIRVDAGGELAVAFFVDTTTEDRKSWNIISETKQGDLNSIAVRKGFRGGDVMTQIAWFDNLTAS
ncbi:unnamed protein product [Clonostachys rhizophaga]|uniref:Uncharacterized protein n=1 Tax=Clonostachys rhizophaga TaxID=160324 RepID=A0A9N9VXM1_9HYPO|nr:unnamed protein product [Clonostachys rhizophaga]